MTILFVSISLMMKLIILNFFDEKTQRTIEKVDEIEIIPATDLLYLDQEVGSVVTQIKDSFEEQYQKMDDLFKDDFEEKIMIDIENLKAHATGSSQYAYYHLFKNVTSIKDYLDAPITIFMSRRRYSFSNQKLYFRKLLLLSRIKPKWTLF